MPPSPQSLARLGDLFWLGPAIIGALAGLAVLLAAFYAAFCRRSMDFTPISLAGFWSMMTCVFAAAVRDSTRESAGWLGPLIVVAVFVALWLIAARARRQMRTS